MACNQIITIKKEKYFFGKKILFFENTLINGV